MIRAALRIATRIGDFLELRGVVVIVVGQELLVALGIGVPRGPPSSVRSNVRQSPQFVHVALGPLVGVVEHRICPTRRIGPLAARVLGDKILIRPATGGHLQRLRVARFRHAHQRVICVRQRRLVGGIGHLIDEMPAIDARKRVRDLRGRARLVRDRSDRWEPEHIAHGHRASIRTGQRVVESTEPTVDEVDLASE